MFENSFLMSLIGFLIILTPLVFIHELGHYIAAKKQGVIVEQFSVGFGPELFGYTDKDNTRWKVCIIPFGGYVKMKGELLVNSENYKHNKINKGYFNNASLFARFLIVFSGPLANILLGTLIISLLYSVNGRYETKPEVSQVVKNSPAERSGLKSNTADGIDRLDRPIARYGFFYHCRGGSCFCGNFQRGIWLWCRLCGGSDSGDHY